MGFTFCHPAAVVLIPRRRLLLSALVIGSMAPDFGYFSHLPLPFGFTHSLPGLFLFSLPVGLAALFLFHTVLKKPLLTLLPPSWQQYLRPLSVEFRFLPPRRALSILASLLVGIATHDLWDACTSNRGWGVVHILGFQTYPPGPQLWLQPHRIANAVSSLAAVLLLLVVCARWFRTARKDIDSPCSLLSSPERRWISVTMVAMATILASIRVTQVLPSALTIDATLELASYFMVYAVPLLFLETLVFALYWHGRFHGPPGVVGNS